MDFTEEQKRDLERYEALKLQEKQVKEELDDLKTKLIAIVPEDTGLALHSGVLKVMTRTNWKFSDRHKDAKKRVKDIEAEEKADGTAKEEIISFLEYKENK